MSLASVSSGQVAATPNKGGSAGIALNKPVVQSNSGALTYSYPIPLPQGRGITPDLALNYNDQSDRDTGFGVGWSVSIPSIERFPKHGIDVLYSEDNFTSTVSGDLSKIDSTHYGAKREHGDFLDYQFSNNVWTVSTKTGLTYVYGKTAGERLDDPADTSRVFRWMLSEIIDTNNNVVKYAYFKDPVGKDIYPDKISYPVWRNPSDGSETSPVFAVSFGRQDRQTYYTSYPNVLGKAISYRAGFRVQTSYILIYIDVSKTGTPVTQPFNRTTFPTSDIELSSYRRYSFGYTRGDDTVRALLTSITPSWRSSTGANVTPPPTQFDYSKSTSAARTWTDSTWQFPPGADYVSFPEGTSEYTAGNRGNSRLVDVDGDGLIDLLSGTKGYRNTGSGWQLMPAWALPSLAYPSNLYCPTGTFQIDLGGGVFKYQSNPVQFADINGDGRTDLIVINSQVHCGQYDFAGATGIFFGGPNGWTPASPWIIPQGSASDPFTIQFTDYFSETKGYRLADINGDGLADIVQSDLYSYDEYSPTTGTSHIFLNTGSGWALSTAFSFPIVNWCSGYHGNLQKRLAFVDSDWGNIVPLSFADMNNDGLNDLILEGSLCTNLNFSSWAPTGLNAVFLNTGSTWVYSGTLPVAPSAQRISGDVNGDGQSPDLLYSQSSGGAGEGVWPIDAQLGGNTYYPNQYTTPQWTFPKRNGCDVNPTLLYSVGFTEPMPYLGYDGKGERQPNPNPLPTATQVADLDGDGLSDLFNVNATVPCDVWYVQGDYGAGYGDYYFNGSYHKFTFTFETKFWRNQGTKPDLLTTITSPHGGTSSITYDMSARLTDETGQHIDTNSPVNLAVVTQISSNGGNNQPAVITSYSYSGGLYRVDSPDSREFTGFRKVTEKDSRGVTTTTWFHQGDGNDASSSEIDDSTPSTSGLPYRVEKRASTGTLRSLDIIRYQRTAAPSIAGDRYFTAAIAVTSEAVESDGSKGWKASTTSYDPLNGNLLKAIDYGEVAGLGSGTFTDSGNDAVITAAYSYATPDASAPHDVGFVFQKLTTDQNSNVIGRERVSFDNLSLGNVSKGNVTSARELIASPGGVETEATTVSSFDVMGLLTSSTDELGTVTNYGYDSNQLYAATSTSTLGSTSFVTKYFYQWTLGMKIAETDASGLSSMTDIDGFGRPLRLSVMKSGESMLHAKESWVFDDTSAKQTFGSPGASVTDTKYATDANDVSPDPVRDATEISYVDGLDREIRHVKMFPDPTGSQTPAPALNDTMYDDRGMTLKTSLAFSGTPGAITAPWRSGTVASPTSSRRWIVNAYDDIGRLSSVTNVLGKTSTAYGARTTTVTDPLSRTKKLTLDARGQLVGVEEHNRDAQGSWQNYLTSYAYDAGGNLSVITDADGNVRHFGYDLLGRRISAEDLHAASDTTFGIYNFAYDKKGDLLTLTNPNATQVNTTYDALGRPSTKDIGFVLWNFTYDTCANGMGRLCQEQLGSTQINYTYDNRGRIATKQLLENSTAQSETYSYTMMDSPNVTTLADGSKIMRDYKAGALYALTTQEKTAVVPVPIVTSFSYLPSGQIAKIAYANGAVTTNTYDANILDRLTRKKTIAPANLPTHGQTTVQDVSYGYNAVGDVTSLTDASQTATAKSVLYTYDDLDRLLSAVATSPSLAPLYAESYTYGPTGNILTKSVASGTNSAIVSTYAYLGNQGTSPLNPHAVTKITTAGIATPVQYNTNGTVSAYASNSYVWDRGGRMSSATSNGTTTTFVYDPDGQRLSSAVGAAVTYFVSPDETTTMNGLVTSSREKRVYAGDLLVATLRGINDSTAKLDIVATDHLTGSSVVTNQSGDIDELIDYLPYGAMRLDQKSGSFNEREKYAGHEYDDTTGLTYMGARYYDASIGRFLSDDPTSQQNPEALMANPQLLNMYSYAANNPLRYNDPTGKGPGDTAGGYIVGVFQGLLAFAETGIDKIVHPPNAIELATSFTKNAQDKVKIVNDLVANPENFKSEVSQGASIMFDEFASSSDFEKGRTIGRPVGHVAGLALTGFATDFVVGQLSPGMVFPENPDNLLPELPRDSKGRIFPNSNTRIRPEIHGPDPGGINSPRHVDQHYHVETRSDSSGNWVKILPPNYVPGQGTAFLPGEEFPGIK